MPAAFSAEQLEKNFDLINERMPGIERQLKILSDNAGIPYELSSAGVPDELVALAEAGKTLEAITLSRKITDADVETARDVVKGL